MTTDQAHLGTRALLAEVLKRAAFDWVLYRTSDRLKYRQIAKEAYVWLFEEGPGHPDWNYRLQEGSYCFSFLAICEALDLDPEQIRAYVRSLRVKDVLASGRPPLHRRPAKNQDAAGPLPAATLHFDFRDLEGAEEGPFY